MLNLPPSVKLYACTTPADMRKSFNGLSALARSHLKKDPLSGHLFIFFNRRQNQCRCLYWDRDGYAIFAKRLARGTFNVPWTPGKELLPTHEMNASELLLVLGGVDLEKTKRRKRWTPVADPFQK